MLAGTRFGLRGMDALGVLLYKILKRIGKSKSSADVLKELQEMSISSVPGDVMQEIDEEGTVFWFSNGKEKITKFRSIENRLTKIRKKIRF